jgi:hypothetical protein
LDLAAKQVKDRVVWTKADMTLGLEVVRLSRHPKCHRQ